MIDAGHGGYDSGAVYNGRREKDDNLNIALAVGNILEERGYEVVYTRTTDVYDSPSEKAREANQSMADLFLSIHRNAFPIPNTVSGVESLIFDKSGIKYEIAENIDKELSKIGFVNLGVKERPDLIVLNQTNMPAILVEVGFLDSDIDNRLLDENFGAVAEAIANGITQVVGDRCLECETKLYQVQVGIYRNKNYGDELLLALIRDDYPAYMEYDDEGYYIIKVGNYLELSEAVEMEQTLKQNGYETIIVTASM